MVEALFFEALGEPSEQPSDQLTSRAGPVSVTESARSAQLSLTVECSSKADLGQCENTGKTFTKIVNLYEM